MADENHQVIETAAREVDKAEEKRNNANIWRGRSLGQQHPTPLLLLFLGCCSIPYPHILSNYNAASQFAASPHFFLLSWISVSKLERQL